MILIHKETAEIFIVQVSKFIWDHTHDSEHPVVDYGYTYYNPRLTKKQLDLLALDLFDQDRHSENFEILGWL